MKIKIGDEVMGIQGIDGGYAGRVTKIHTERGRRIITFVTENGSLHDTPEYNITKNVPMKGIFPRKNPPRSNANKWYDRASIPNQEHFKMLLLLDDGREIVGKVFKNRRNGMHSLIALSNGEPIAISKVNGWKSIDSVIEERQYRKNPPRSNADATAARELELWIDNNADLYRQKTVPIMKSLIKEIKNGSYDSTKAIKLWGYLIEAGAKSYAKEFANPSEWSTMFNRATRDLTALEYAKQFEQNLAAGDYDEFLGAKTVRLNATEQKPWHRLVPLAENP